MILIIH